jgi:RecJ-like exonuclease
MVHLGRAVNSISSDLGGSGGGHDRACGAVIPKERMKTFIEKLDAVISNNKN